MEDYSKYNDADLAALLRSGNDAAFKEIYERYSRLLYLFAYNKLRDENEAIDVVHDIFASLLANKENFAIKTSISSYLYKSVLNKIFDIFRRQATIRKYIEQGDHFIEVDSIKTDYLIREKDIAEMIEQEIAAMPPKMREVYKLKFKEYLNPKEIAERLNISENTVNTHLKRAIKQMKDNLGIAVVVIYILNN